MIPAVPEGWTLGIGDRDGTYVARSQLHEEMTGKPGLPEYLAKVVGRSGTFTSRNFQGMTLLAGYYRSDFSNWFYTANIAAGGCAGASVAFSRSNRRNRPSGNAPVRGTCLCSWQRVCQSRGRSCGSR